jgi:hypothetical protein
MARSRPEKKSEPAAPTERRILPMQLQVGDRLTDEAGEWQVIGRPYTTAGGKDARVRVKPHRRARIVGALLESLRALSGPHPGPAPGARFHPGDAAAQEAQDPAHAGAGGPGAPDPPPHARQLTLGHVLAAVAGLPGSSIKLLESEILVRSVPPSHVLNAATRRFPASHQLAHQVRVFAVLLRDLQVVVRTERSSHRLTEIQVAVLSGARG